MRKLLFATLLFSSVACAFAQEVDEEGETRDSTVVAVSMLDIPNVMTPDSPSGANRTFKVKAQSLRSFELWVFNRWGNQLFHTTDVTEGWDGTHDGKSVPTGAYYYVVKAVGEDDIKYNRKGSINVLRSKSRL